MDQTKNKKRALVAAILAACAVLSITAATFFRARAANFFRNGAAFAAGAWNAAFPAPPEGIFSSEVALDDLASTSSAVLDGDPSLLDAASDVPDASSGTVIGSDHGADAPNHAPSKVSKAGTSLGDPPTTSTEKEAAFSSTTKTISSTMNGLDALPTAAVSRQSESIVAPPTCGFASTTAPSRKVILSEVAWMGSPATGSESVSAAGSREWLELKNISGSAVDLFGWQIVNARRTIKIFFDGHRELAPGNFAVAARGSASTSMMSADRFYSGALANGGDSLFVFDGACALSDLLDASSGWPGGDNDGKFTLERDIAGFGWHTSVPPGGTPGAENSVPPVVPSVPAAPVLYPVTVTLSGMGSGSVSSSPGGIMCGSDCTENFSSGKVISFSASPAASSAFVGWTGPCTGLGSCSFVVTASTTLGAGFERLMPDEGLVACATGTGPTGAGGPPDDGARATTTATSTATTTMASPEPPDHLVIAVIAIAGASSTNDLVKIFNPTAVSADIGGWKLRKKTSTGSDQSVRVFPAGSVAASGAYFVWANSEGGFSETIDAQVSSTATLAADNSAALFDASGTIVDAVAWGEGADQYVEGAPFAVDPGAGEVLVRRSSENTLVDTDNNADDFVIQ